MNQIANTRLSRWSPAKFLISALSVPSILPLPLVLALSLSACSSKEVAKENADPSPVTSAESDNGYGRQIEKYSDGEAEYAGFYNNFEYKATILNSMVRSAMLGKQSNYYQWDREKLTNEREKSDKDMSQETTIFLSFFTPDRKNDNLTDQKTIWRVYLESGGRRYSGKAKKVRSLLAELQVLYPYHTRWNTPYLVTFPVPTNAIETQASTLTVTGPLGTRTVKFPSLN